MELKGNARANRQAKTLRRALTPPEARLWVQLRASPGGLRFRRQHAAGLYILDFFCAPAKLAIEVDGEAHARGDRPARDAVREAWLAEQGVAVLRIPAIELLHDLEAAVTHIVETARSRL